MRPAIIQAYSLGVFTGAAFTAGAVLLATPAKADPDATSVSYTNAYGPAVCEVLDEYPNFPGVLGVASAIHDDGLSWKQAGWVLTMSVGELCPRHTALLAAFAKTYGGQAA